MLTYRYCSAGKYCKLTTIERRKYRTEYCTSECRFTPLDHPPQRTIGDHQLMNMNHQTDTVQNDMYLPPNNASTPFQPHNQNPILVQQQDQLDPSGVVVQHLQQQALNQSQLNNT